MHTNKLLQQMICYRFISTAVWDTLTAHRGKEEICTKALITRFLCHFHVAVNGKKFMPPLTGQTLQSLQTQRCWLLDQYLKHTHTHTCSSKSWGGQAVCQRSPCSSHDPQLPRPHPEHWTPLRLDVMLKWIIKSMSNKLWQREYKNGSCAHKWFSIKGGKKCAYRSSTQHNAARVLKS